jgi:hypothetical protein
VKYLLWVVVIQSNVEGIGDGLEKFFHLYHRDKKQDFENHRYMMHEDFVFE